MAPRPAVGFLGAHAQGDADPAQPPIPESTATYCLPSGPLYVIGLPMMPDGHLKRHSSLAPAIHLAASAVLVITTRPDPHSATPLIAKRALEYPSVAEVIGLLLHVVFLDGPYADAKRRHVACGRPSPGGPQTRPAAPAAAVARSRSPGGRAARAAATPAELGSARHGRSTCGSRGLSQLSPL